MFTKASTVKKKLKVLIYGPSGSGKTHMALTFPRPAVIDMEGGTDLFADRFDFDVLRTKDHAEVMQAVDYIAANPDQYETLIIDPITVLWQVLMEAGQMMAERRATRKGRNPDEASLTQRDWGIIKRKVNALYTRLVNMPCHVVMVGRIKDVNETRGQNVVKVGEKVDAEKSTAYIFDVVVKLTLNGKRIGLVEKDRSGKLQGQQVENPDFATFADILTATSTGEHVTHQDPGAAAAALSKTMDQAQVVHWIDKIDKDDKPIRNRFWAWATGDGENNRTLTKEQVYTALQVERIHAFKGTMGEAKEKIDQWIALQAEIDVLYPTTAADPEEVA